METITSVVIPAYNEPYLQDTINDIFQKSKKKVEVIVILDGYWPHPEITDREDLIIIHKGKTHGMRSAINVGASIAKGKYLMKCDAHCAFDEHFDEKIINDCEAKCVIVPKRYRLNTKKYSKEGNPHEFQYIEKGTLKGRNWKDYAKRVEGQEVVDLMTTQGSCWFMHKDWFFEIGGLDDINYGHMGREAQEVCLKTWLNGGRFLLTRKTWYAHWNKPKEHVVTNPKEKRKSVAYAQSYWTEDKIRVVIEKFAPVPTWEDVEMVEPIVDKRIMETRLESSNGVVKVVKNGMNRLELYKYFASLGFKTGAEIGVQRGRNAIVMIDNIPDLKLYLIDPYMDYEWSNRKYGEAHHAKVRRMTHKRMKDKNVVFIEDFSENAVRQFQNGTLDFVYIDGMHTYDFVMMDLILWTRVVREGGVVSGHDYVNNRNVIGVVHAVDDYVRRHKIEPLYLTDTKATRASGDKSSSWFFVKPSKRELIGKVKDCTVGRRR